jgi:hypothetical protein
MGTAAVFALPFPPFEAERLRVEEVGGGAELVETEIALVEGGEEEGVGREERSLTLLPGLVESPGTLLGSSLIKMGRVAADAEFLLACRYACWNSSLSSLTGGLLASERSEKALRDAERAEEGDWEEEN